MITPGGGQGCVTGEVMVSALIGDYSNLVVKVLRKLYIKAQTQTLIFNCLFKSNFSDCTLALAYIMC